MDGNNSFETVLLCYSNLYSVVYGQVDKHNNPLGGHTINSQLVQLSANRTC